MPVTFKKKHKHFAWSHSALDVFITCPRKYWAEKVVKVVPWKESPQAAYGKVVHKHFEDRLMKGTKLPMDLTHHEKVMAKFADAPGEGFPEQQLALDRNYQPTGWFDKDCHIRGIIDYVKINGTHAIIVDHKTGRQKDGFRQLDLMFAMISVFQPQVQTATGMFYWTQGKKIVHKKYTRDDVAGIWADYLPEVNRLQAAFDDDLWPTKTNGLCRKWCDYTECQYNGKN